MILRHTQTEKYAPFPALLYVMRNCLRSLTLLDKKFDEELRGLIHSLQKVKLESNEKHDDYNYAVKLIEEITKIIKEIDISVVNEHCSIGVSQIKKLVHEVEMKLSPPKKEVTLETITELAKSIDYVKEGDQPFFHLFNQATELWHSVHEKLIKENEILKQQLNNLKESSS